MKSFTSFLVLLLAAVVQAVSSSGNRLVAIFDDLSDKASYSKFLGDLEGVYSPLRCDPLTHGLTLCVSEMQVGDLPSPTRRPRACRCPCSTSAPGDMIMPSSSLPSQRVCSQTPPMIRLRHTGQQDE